MINSEVQNFFSKLGVGFFLGGEGGFFDMVKSEVQKEFKVITHPISETSGEHLGG